MRNKKNNTQIPSPIETPNGTSLSANGTNWAKLLENAPIAGCLETLIISDCESFERFFHNNLFFFFDKICVFFKNNNSLLLLIDIIYLFDVLVL